MAALSSVYRGSVLDGPFAGMKYVEQAVGSGWFPKVLGRYERELHGVIGEIIAGGFGTIVDIGCAEGYYAIGLALRCPTAQVLAYDIDEHARTLCGELATRNGVEGRVSIRGRCEPEELRQLNLVGRAVVISDCEGFELEVLDPKRVPWLAAADILVELHDFLIPGLKDQLLPRFEATHIAQVIDSQCPTIGSEPVFAHLSQADQVHGLGERWPPMQWAWLRSKNPGGNSK
jgi:hypothetical protein